MTQEQIITLIQATANRYGVDPNLAVEVARAESNFNPAAISPAGAIGVMQLMPATAADLGVNPYDAAQNIDGGVRYLKMLLTRYDGNVAATLAAYNWGLGRVDAALAQGGDWLSRAPAETRAYVARILARYTPFLSSGSSTLRVLLLTLIVLVVILWLMG